MVRVIIFLRGHERGVFRNQNMNHFIQQIYDEFHKENCETFLHTWKKSDASSSWRKTGFSYEVTCESIVNYFKHPIHYLLEDEDCCEIHGTTTGKIGSMPVLSWKKMWSGIYNGISEISKNHEPNTIILNMRLDYFSCSSFKKHNVAADSIIRKCRNILERKNSFEFTHDSLEYDGIDNFSIATLCNMKSFVSHFHENLDHISSQYDFLVFHEGLVFIEAQRIFKGHLELNKLTYLSMIVSNQLNAFFK